MSYLDFRAAIAGLRFFISIHIMCLELVEFRRCYYYVNWRKNYNKAHINVFDIFSYCFDASFYNVSRLGGKL